MADTFKISDGTSTVLLMYEAAPGWQALASGIKFGTPDHDMQYHQSDYTSGEMLTRERITNRRWPMKLALKGDSDDDNIGNELTELNRLIRQARRYHLNDGDVAEVYLEVKLDSATNTTYYTLIDGEVKADIFNLHNRNTSDVKFGSAVTVELVTKPQGYGAQTTLENELINSHMEEDGNSDTISDGWKQVAVSVIFNGPTTVDTTNSFTSTGGAARGEWWSQIFTANFTGRVQIVTASMKRIGTPGGNVKAYIYSSDGTGEPSAQIGDPSSTNQAINSIDTSSDDVVWGWSGEDVSYPLVLINETYFIVFKTTGYVYAGDSTDALFFETDANGTTGDEVFGYDSDDPDTWAVSAANERANFLVQGGVPGRPNTTYMTGVRSQRFKTGTAGTEGIISNTIDCSNNQSQDFVAYAHVYRTVGSDEITLDIQGDDSGSIGTRTYSACTTTFEGEDGNTWKRLQVLGATNSTDTTLDMRVQRLTGDASAATTFHVDKCYLQLNQSTIPDAWMSCSHIKNYFETDTPGAVPYVDVTDVPGDLPAETIYLIESDSVENIYIGRWSRDNPIALDYWSTGTGNTDAARAGNTYDSSEVGPNVYVQVFTQVGLDNITPGKYALLTAMSVSTSTATMLMRGGATIDAASNWLYSDDKSIDLNTTYKMYTTLPIDFSSYPQANIDSAGYTVSLKSSSGTHTIYTDFIMLMPVDEGYCVIGNSNTPNTKTFVLEEDIAGSSSAYVMTTSDSTDPGVRVFLGKLIKLEPGKEQRLLFMTNSTSDAHVLASGDITVKLRYRPRTEFLLGTS